MSGAASGRSRAANRGSWTLALLFALVLAGYSIVSFLPGNLGLENRLVTVPFRALVLSLSLVVIYSSIVTRGTLNVGVAILPALLFWCLYAVRMLTDTVFDPIPLKMPPAEYLLYGFGVCVVPMLAFLAPTDRQTLNRAFNAAVAGLGVACTLALTAHRNLLEAESGRLHANDYLNPISLGHLGVSLAVLSAFAILRGVRPGPRLVGLYGLLLVGLTVVGLAGSRSPVLALLAVTPFLLWACRTRGASGRMAGLLGLLLLGVPLIVRKIEVLGSDLVPRLLMTPQRVEGFREARMELWGDAWELFLDNPVFGNSLDLPGSAYPHNLVLESFMATGIFGGTAFAIALAIALIQALRSFARRSEQSWIGLLFLQLLILAQFSGALYTSGSLWCTMAAVLSLSSSSARGRARDATEFDPIRTGRPAIV